ncbi:hypothetical protein COZ71_07345 [Candidatus Desantisbacteria bacterium CG_4_8_14_3_um_filter_40_12]|uniref:Uncharacterized protein n=1 Tax=Candidatus Desantisbacteria bacterium CG_4_8_14_3_um_filter_40_12 TaxID=1974545 RepID=A0A2M7JAZ3_9BACT|nr:MAG: hypothetical protein COZ71_07345 [Candidatus Desantisbacteria bacterium CG_4_8_14_3_um_filter_40_12]
MAKRVVLGKGIDSIFNITKPILTSVDNGNKTEIQKFIRLSKQPKFKTFDIKLSILLRQDQLDWLSLLERKVMKNRSSRNKKERITKNTIIRACLDLIKEIDFDVREIADEAEFLLHLKHALVGDREDGRKEMGG